MKKIISLIVAVIGFLAAIIGIWTYYKTVCNDISGNIQILIDEPVFWEAYPATIKVNITKGKSNINDYKVVIFQRNSGQDPEQENHMFEKLLMSTSDELRGSVYYGSASQGNKDDFIVTALVV
ncbi:MAG: hypothetical protein K8S18_05850, partial [Desulfobacula sp.]|nr:hypothetical protein [Desulfobacula sp.]